VATKRVFVLVCGGLTTESENAQSEPTPTQGEIESYPPVSYRTVTSCTIRLSSWVVVVCAGSVWALCGGLSILCCASFFGSCFLFVLGVVLWCCSVGE